MRHFRKIFCGIFMATMLFVCNISVLAAEVHNFNQQISHKGIKTETYGHTHYTGGPNGTTVAANCLVTINTYRKVEKCHCGETRTTEYSVTHHSVK